MCLPLMLMLMPDAWRRRGRRPPPLHRPPRNDLEPVQQGRPLDPGPCCRASPRGRCAGTTMASSRFHAPDHPAVAVMRLLLVAARRRPDQSCCCCSCCISCRAQAPKTRRLSPRSLCVVVVVAMCVWVSMWIQRARLSGVEYQNPRGGLACCCLGFSPRRVCVCTWMMIRKQRAKNPNPSLDLLLLPSSDIQGVTWDHHQKQKHTRIDGMGPWHRGSNVVHAFIPTTQSHRRAFGLW
jgi:hypothetical protein